MSNTRRLLGVWVVTVGLLQTATVRSAHEQAISSRASVSSPKERENNSTRTITEAQLENVARRITLAKTIVERFEGDAKRLGLSSGWRQATLEALLPLSLVALQQVESRSPQLDRLSSTLSELPEEPNLIGDPDEDLVYFPIAPCRYADTRIVGGAINGVRGFDIANNGATYGGNSGCAPTTLFGADENSIGALVLNVTAVNPTIAPGFVAVKPTAAAPVTSLVNWYEVGAQAANQAIVSLDQSGLTDEFVIQTPVSVDVILDVFGAFLAPHATQLATQTVETNLLVSASTDFNESAVCPTGYSMTGGGYSYFGPSTNIWIWQSGPLATNTGWGCRGRNDTGTLVDVTCFARCARVPGR